MKVLVLGASGLIGNAIARELVARGHEVSGSCRKAPAPANLAGLPLRIHSGDLDAPGQLSAWATGQEVIVDAAAPYPLYLMHSPPGRAEPASRHARQRAERLVAAAESSGARLVHIGTRFTTISRGGRGLSAVQRRVMRVLHPYFSVKAALEATLERSRGRVPGIQIVRPPACLGPWDVKPRDQTLVPKLLDGSLRAAADHELNLLDTRDLARFVAAGVEARTPPAALELCGHNTSVAELLRGLSEISGGQPPGWLFPAALSVLPSYWSELAWGMIGRPAPLPSLLPVLMCEQSWCRPGEAQTAFGIQPRPLAETLNDTIAWYRELGYC